MKVDTALRFGAEEVRITPPVGVDLGGYVGRRKHSIRLQDDLYARALAITVQGQMLILVSCDLLGMSPDYVKKLKRDIGKRVDTGMENVIIACTHTHSGPATIMLNRCGGVNNRYMETLRKKIVACAFRAAKSQTRGKIGISRAKETIGVNRRSKQAIDEVILKPDPCGPVDPEIKVLCIEGEEKCAMILSYACHPVVLGPDNLSISSDYPGAVARRLRDLSKKPLVPLFLNGACGDINSKVHGGQASDVETLGRKIADKASVSLKSGHDIGDFEIKVKEKRVRLPLYIPSRKEIRSLLEKYKKKLESQRRNGATYMETEISQAFIDWGRRALNAMSTSSVTKHKDITISGVALGTNICLVVIPAEVFVEIGKDIKKSSPFRDTLIVCYGNGVLGYIGTSNAYT